MARGRGRKPLPRNQSVKPPVLEDSSSESDSDSSVQVTPKTPLELGELIDHFIPTKSDALPQPNSVPSPKEVPSKGAPLLESDFKVGTIEIPKIPEFPDRVGTEMGHEGTESRRSIASLFNPKLIKGMDLQFVASEFDLVDLDLEDIQDDLCYWDKTLVGCFIGSRISLPKIHEFMRKHWNHISIPKVLHLKKNWFYFLFDSIEDRDTILRGGPWFLVDCSLILKKWHPKIFHELETITLVPIWVTFPFLDPMLWTQRALSKIASKIGNPLFADPITSSKERISFARVMIEVDIAQPLKSSIDIKSPFGGTHSQLVSYEWVPYFCHSCKKMGYDMDHCKATSKIFVPKKSLAEPEPVLKSTAGCTVEPEPVLQINAGCTVEQPTVLTGQKPQNAPELSSLNQQHLNPTQQLGTVVVEGSSLEGCSSIPSCSVQLDPPKNRQLPLSFSDGKAICVANQNLHGSVGVNKQNSSHDFAGIKVIQASEPDLSTSTVGISQIGTADSAGDLSKSTGPSMDLTTRCNEVHPPKAISSTSQILTPFDKLTYPVIVTQNQFDPLESVMMEGGRAPHGKT